MNRSNSPKNVILKLNAPNNTASNTKCKSWSKSVRNKQKHHYNDRFLKDQSLQLVEQANRSWGNKICKALITQKYDLMSVWKTHVPKRHGYMYNIL